MDRSSVISSRSSRTCSTTSATASRPSLEVPDGGTGWQWSPIQHWGGGLGWRSNLRITPPLSAFLPHLGLFGHSFGLILLEGRGGLSNFHHLLALLLPFSFLGRQVQVGGAGHMGGGVGGLVRVAFLSASIPGWDFIRSSRLNLGLRWIPILSIISVNGWPRSKDGWPRSGVEVSGNKAWLKTSNSSSESDTSTISSSSVSAGWEEVATLVVCYGGEATFGMPLGIGLVVSIPSGTRPLIRKLRTATLIRCSRGSLALITNFGA